MPGVVRVVSQSVLESRFLILTIEFSCNIKAVATIFGDYIAANASMLRHGYRTHWKFTICIDEYPRQFHNEFEYSFSENQGLFFNDNNSENHGECVLSLFPNLCTCLLFSNDILNTGVQAQVLCSSPHKKFCKIAAAYPGLAKCRYSSDRSMDDECRI